VYSTRWDKHCTPPWELGFPTKQQMLRRETTSFGGEPALFLARVIQLRAILGLTVRFTGTGGGESEEDEDSVQ